MLESNFKNNFKIILRRQKLNTDLEVPKNKIGHQIAQ